MNKYIPVSGKNVDMNDLVDYIVERLVAEIDSGNHGSERYAMGWSDAMRYAINRVEKASKQYRAERDLSS